VKTGSPLARLREKGLRASKKRGQHFLVNAGVADRILRAVGAGPEDVVLEVGAGLGALTRGLAENARAVVAVEVDRGLASILREDFQGSANVLVEEADVLDLDPGAIAERLGARRVRVVGNLPYCLTAPILLWLVEHARVISDAFVMVQAEVADRIVAGPGGANYGPLTLAVRFWCEARVLFRVSPGSFSPPPAVGSAFVHLRIPGTPRVSVKDRDLYFDIVRRVFSQRRKMLKNTLLELEGVEENRVRALAARTGMDLRRRPQELGPHDFARLADALGDL
jgi:16S rRNA (adenine1518-N6/adenine1519-N6)-dimethyltransferase